MINSLNDLINVSKTFSMPEGKIETKEKGRLEFISKFPLTSIQSLNLDDYCIGTSENSFCYWLEFKDILFGIGGGNASKFGIYKSKDGNYCESYGTKKISLEGEALEEKFSKLKQSIVQGLKFVEKNEVEKISTIQTSVWNMVLLKIFCIYYPNLFLTIGDPDVIIECARNIGITNIELKSENSILINYLCRKKLNETPEFSSWEYEKIGTLAWETFKATAKRDYYLIGSKYGENADKDVFPEMLNRSVIATGFASNLDLTELYNANHTVIKEYLMANNQNDNSINALKHFLSLRPGDLVAIKSDGSPKGKEGYLSIVGIAEIVEKNGKVYEHDPGGLGQIINVKYLQAPIFKELALGGYGRTIHKLSNDEHIKLIFKTGNEMNYYEELIKFLAQTETADLGTSSYLNSFQGLSVKVSFGKGNQARIPWIAFLKKTDTVQEGIYPVYLYYKDKKLLILAYGISETHKPSNSWNISNGKTIEQYFAENMLGKPERYGNSYVFKSYYINQSLVKEEINRDLIKLINIYKASSDIASPFPPEKFQYNNFNQSISSAGLFINNKISLHSTTSLLTKPFVILTGLSGSGKTKLAQAFAMWICENEKQYCLVPVGADWTNREPLLGFPNALETGKYVKPDNRVLDLIIAANTNEHKPYFLILDEMNLSHVERYFADFLSAMELSNGFLRLHDETGHDWDGVPAKLEIPRNLFVIGTVNVDETTYMFSPKVLDRANVIEFRVSDMEMKSFLENPVKPDLDEIAGQGAQYAKAFVAAAKQKDVALEKTLRVQVSNELMKFFPSLKEMGAEFGYRTAHEISRFVYFYKELSGADFEFNLAMDASIMQKLLPKLHGSKKKLGPVLGKLKELCDGRFPVSTEKIIRMQNRLAEHGFTSFAEA